MRSLRGFAFFATVMAFILNPGELVAQPSPLEPSLEPSSDVNNMASPSSSPDVSDPIASQSPIPALESEPVQSISVPLQTLVTNSLELATNAVLEPTPELLPSEDLALEPTPELLPSEAEIPTPKQPQPLSEFEGISPSTQAHDLSMNWMDQVEWQIAQTETQPTQTAQADPEEEEDPRKAADATGRRLSNNYNYIGIGGNIGLVGDTSGLGTGGGMTLSKTGFSENVSLHSGGILIADEGASLVHLTYDFPIRTETGAVKVSPFIGAGVIYKDLFNNDFSFGPSATVGIDYPISYSFLLTGRASVGYIREETEFGIQLGFTYVYTRGLLDILF